jgi:hypothetical protein
VVEERGVPRGVNQRTFDVRSDEVPTAASPSVPVSPAVPLGEPKGVARGPSDLALRERQLRWMRERARFLARLEPSEPGEPPSR